MADVLQMMLDAQHKFQQEIAPERGGGDPVELLSPDYIRVMKDALESELDELQNETGWKPWATSRHVHIEAARGEWIDAWHFMMNIAIALEMDSKMIWELYFLKLAKNKQRQRENYDGVSTKCQMCRRALDDDTVKCVAATEKQSGYCDAYAQTWKFGDLISYG